MNYPATLGAIVEPPSWRTELLIVGTALALAVGALMTPLALPLAVSGLVFVLAALRVKPLLPIHSFLLAGYAISQLGFSHTRPEHAGAVQLVCRRSAVSRNTS